MSKTNKVTNVEVEIDQLKVDTLALEDTSKKIRFLSSKGKSTKEIYHLLSSYGITTKNNGEIRYQHVRNVLMTNLTTK